MKLPFFEMSENLTPLQKRLVLKAQVHSALVHDPYDHSKSNIDYLREYNINNNADFLRELELIKEKKSKLPSSIRKIILSYEK